MRMEPTESSETSAINVTWTPGTYPKDNKLQLEHSESLKSRAQYVLLRDGGIYPKPGAGKEPSVAIHLHLQNTFKYVVAYSIGILFLTATTSCSYLLQTTQN